MKSFNDYIVNSGILKSNAKNIKNTPLFAFFRYFPCIC